MKSNHEETKQSRLGSGIFEWGEALVVALTTIVLLFTFVIRLIGVEGSSMYPTLHDQDKILMSNAFYTPRKGDIVVLTKQSFLDSPVVKRVIATEGDLVDINFSTMEVLINGKVLEEPYTNAETVPPLLIGDMIFPQTVPENCIFVLGDNRNHSSDSRIVSLGMVDTRYILGHVFFRLSPLNRIGGVN